MRIKELIHLKHLAYSKCSLRVSYYLLARDLGGPRMPVGPKAGIGK